MRVRSRCVIVAEDLLGILRWKHIDGVGGARPNVCLPSPSVPPDCAEQADETRHADGIVHVACLDRLRRGEEQYHTDEDDPCDCNRVDGLAPLAHGIWSGVELDLSFVPSMRNDDSNVANVQGWRGNVEDGGDGQRASNADQIEAAAEGDDEPDRVDRRVCVAIDLAPEAITCVSLRYGMFLRGQKLTPKTERRRREKTPTPSVHSPAWQSNR